MSFPSWVAMSGALRSIRCAVGGGSRKSGGCTILRMREMRMAAEAGYTCAFLNYGGGVSQKTSPRFGLPRAHVTAGMNLPELEANLTGFHQRLQRWNGADGKQDEMSARRGV